MTDRALLLDTKWGVDGNAEVFNTIITDRPIINIETEAGRAADQSAVGYAVVWHPQPGFLASLPNLEVIFSLGAGVDHIFKDDQLPDCPIVRFVDSDLTGRMVEWVVLQVLMHLRLQPAYTRQQQEGIWKDLQPQPAARHARVGIMGLGELGQASARGLLPLGFKINGWSRSPKQMDGVVCYHGETGLGEFLTNTDFLVALLPHTPATHGILNRDLFKRLSREGPFRAPVIINAGRGGSQVETDIISGLEDGTLAGASLDVFQTEPLAAKNPLWSARNVVITPHIAAVSDPTALAKHVKRQIARYESGKALENLVDRNQGY